MGLATSFSVSDTFSRPDWSPGQSGRAGCLCILKASNDEPSISVETPPMLRRGWRKQLRYRWKLRALGGKSEDQLGRRRPRLPPRRAQSSASNTRRRPSPNHHHRSPVLLFGAVSLVLNLLKPASRSLPRPRDINRRRKRSKVDINSIQLPPAHYPSAHQAFFQQTWSPSASWPSWLHSFP